MFLNQPMKRASRRFEGEKNELAGGPWRRHRSEAAVLLTERQTWELDSQQDVANFVEETWWRSTLTFKFRTLRLTLKQKLFHYFFYLWALLYLSFFITFFKRLLRMSVSVAARIRLTLIWLRFSYPRSKLTQNSSPSPVHAPAPGRSRGRSRMTRPAPTHPPRLRLCSRSPEEPRTSSQTSAS